MKVTLVDENDNVIGTEEVRQVVWDKVTYRSAALWLTNSKNEVLIAQRAFHKEQSPGLWGPAAAGIVEPHETYLSNVLKETEEEIGLSFTAAEVTEGPKLTVSADDPPRRFTMQWFLAKRDVKLDECTIDPDEVAAIKWVLLAEPSPSITDSPEQFEHSLPLLLTQLHNQE